MIRTTADWMKELARSERGTPMHTAVSEVVRLREELEELANTAYVLANAHYVSGGTRRSGMLGSIEQGYYEGITHILEGKNHD